MKDTTRRDELIAGAAIAAEGFRFRPGVPRRATHGFIELFTTEYLDAGVIGSMIGIKDGGPPSSDLTGIVLRIMEVETGHIIELTTNELGYATCQNLNPNIEYSVVIGHKTVAVTRPVARGADANREPSVPVLSATSAGGEPPPDQEYPDVPFAERAVLRFVSESESFFHLIVRSDDAFWHGRPLARVRFEIAGKPPLVDRVIGLYESVDFPGRAQGVLDLISLSDAAYRHECKVVVAPVRAIDLVAELGRDGAIAYLQDSRRLNKIAESRHIIDGAVESLTIEELKAEPPAVPVPIPAKEEPPVLIELVATSVTADAKSLADVNVKLVDLESLFRQKIARHEEYTQHVSELTKKLREAEVDLHFKILKPALLKMLEWHTTLANVKPISDVVTDLLQDLEDYLFTLGVEKFESDSVHFNPSEQTANPIHNEDPQLAGQIKDRIRPGFRYGKVLLRSESVSVYKKPITK